MPRIIRNRMLKYIPRALPEMKNPDMRRIFDFNNKVKSLSYIRGQNEDKVGPVSKIFLIFYN